MNEENEAAPAEGEVLPESAAPPLPQSWIEEAVTQVDSIEQRVIAAIEAWYAGHFHRAAVAGLPAISTDDKAALVQSVTAAVALP